MRSDGAALTDTGENNSPTSYDYGPCFSDKIDSETRVKALAERSVLSRFDAKPKDFEVDTMLWSCFFIGDRSYELTPMWASMRQ
jgi:hypothetical protein